MNYDDQRFVLERIIEDYGKHLKMLATDKEHTHTLLDHGGTCDMFCQAIIARSLLSIDGEGLRTLTHD